nr:hypothetical protein [Tanacetum cinerariifolium]
MNQVAMPERQTLSYVGNCSMGNDYITRQYTQSKKVQWLKQRMMLAQLQEAWIQLSTEQLAIFADTGERVDSGLGVFTVITHALFQLDGIDLYDSDYDEDTNSSTPNDLLVLSLVEQITDQAKRIKPTLYDSSVIAKEHAVISMIDDEETFILEEESQSKMLDKQNDSILVKQKINISPIDYSKLNNLKEDFGKRFVAQQELSAEQAFWLQHSSISKTPVTSHTPVIIKAPSELPKVSLVNESLKLKYQLANFDKVVKKRLSSDAITAGSWGFEHTKECFVTEIIPFLKVLKDTFNVFDKTLLDEITEVVVDQYSVNKKFFEIEKKELKLENERLLEHIICQDVVNNVMHADVKFDKVLHVPNTFLEDNIALDVRKMENDRLMELLVSQDLVHTAAKRIKPTLYDSSVIAKEHAVISMIDDEETFILEEESQSKMLDKQNDSILVKQKINISPIDYSKLNNLKEDFDFGKRFVPQQELSVEQAFWLQTSHPNTDQSATSPVKIKAPRELLKVSLVNTSLKKLKYHLGKFDIMVKKRITPDAITEWERDKKLFEIEKKELKLENGHLLEHIICQDVVNIVMHADVKYDNVLPVQSTFLDDNIALDVLKMENDHLMELLVSQDLIHTVVNSLAAINDYKSMERSYIEEYEMNLKLAAELSQMYELSKTCSRLEQRLYKLDLELLSSKLTNNRETHVDYIRITKENADTLRDIVEQARTLNPLDNALAYAYYEILFQPLFDEYFNPSPHDVSPDPVAVTAPKVIDPVGSPSSTTIDQDVPYASTSPTNQEIQSQVIHQGVEEQIHEHQNA